MSSENAPKGVAVGDLADDVVLDESEPKQEDTGSVNGEEGTDDGAEAMSSEERAEIDHVLSGDDTHVPEDAAISEEDNVRYAMPDSMVDMKEHRGKQKLFIKFYKSTCFKCVHLRPGVSDEDKAATKNMPCLYTKGNDQCPAGYLQLSAVSRFTRIASSMVRKMEKAKDPLEVMGVMDEFKEKMKGAPAKHLEQGLKQLAQAMPK